MSPHHPNLSMDYGGRQYVTFKFCNISANGSQDNMQTSTFWLKEGRALRMPKFCWKINMQLQLDFSYERLVGCVEA